MQGERKTPKSSLVIVYVASFHVLIIQPNQMLKISVINNGFWYRYQSVRQRDSVGQGAGGLDSLFTTVECGMLWALPCV